MKIKTADLIRLALNWAVAQCEMMQEDYRDRGLLVHRIGYGHPMPPYSINWAQGGPIIEREKIELRCNDYEWQAFCFGFPVSRAHSGTRTWAAGPTPLIAAARCLVASRIGDEVDIPEELLS